jgi:phage-related protein
LDALINTVQQAANTVGGTLAGVVNSTRSAVENVALTFNRTTDAAGNLTSTVGAVFEGARNATSNGFTGVIGTVTNITSGAFNATRAAGEDASTALASFVNGTQQIASLGAGGTGSGGSQNAEAYPAPWASSAGLALLPAVVRGGLAALVVSVMLW